MELNKLIWVKGRKGHDDRLTECGNYRVTMVELGARGEGGPFWTGQFLREGTWVDLGTDMTDPETVREYQAFSRAGGRLGEGREACQAHADQNGTGPKGLSTDSLRVGATYRGKRRRIVGVNDDLSNRYNDRTIIWMDEARMWVQYDGPAVRYGQHYPRVSVEDFLAWAKEELS